MTGYYRQPVETQRAFTTDISIMDERGQTKIIDRKKDMMIISGFNVVSNELKNLISLCSALSNARRSRFLW